MDGEARRIAYERSRARGACPTCEGCGQVATDDERTPWWHWAALPFPSDLSVRLGLVRPETCPECGGTGKKSDG